MLFFLFLEIDQLLLQDLLQVLNKLLVVLLNLGDLNLGSLQDVIFDLVTVALHRQIQPLLQASFKGTSLVILLAPLLHLPQIFVLEGVLLPGVEEGALVVFGVEEIREVFDLISFFLNLPQRRPTFLLRMQYASNSFLLWL